MTLSTFLRDLKDEYLALHTHKEDQFWQAKMGLTKDAAAAQEALGKAEIAVNRFLQSPERLKQLRDLESTGKGSDADRYVLRGWIAMLAAHVIEDPAGRKLSEQIVEREQQLEHARGDMNLGYIDPHTGHFCAASSVRLSLMMRVEHDERRRRAAFDGLRSIEPFVLDSGFLDIVSMRNKLGRLLGYEDYYDWKVQTVEKMSKRALFAKLDDLAKRTAERTTRELRHFELTRGLGSLEPWNFPYLRSGRITEAIDPYFTFVAAMWRWVITFSSLGVSFRGATLTLDLLDRRGKYENGFMHGPEPAFFDEGTWRPARINFTANSVPAQIGSGLRAAETLFHEGGHAAHFSNILQPAPCFSQEFAPTSVAYAETQSMFMDSLLGDADWRRRYAFGNAGVTMPMELIEEEIRDTQPMRGWEVRSMLTVPFAERAIYEMDERDRTPERVLRELRRIESDLQGLTAGVRPVLAVPHLLSGEASAYYHGYVLAEMASYQTRDFFINRDGYLTDNPRIGPDLAKHYWAPGNSVSFDDTVKSLTGHSVSADALARECNQSVDEAIAEARHKAARIVDLPRLDLKAASLDANIRVVHGNREISSTERGGLVGLCKGFEVWVREQEQMARDFPHLR